MFLSKNPVEGELILIIEVQSASIRSSLVWLRSSLPPQMLSTEHRDIPHKPHVNQFYYIKAVVKALKEISGISAERAHALAATKEKDGVFIPKRIKAVHCVLSSPWVASHAKALSIGFGHEETVTPEKIESIIKEERRKMAPNSGGSYEPIEEKIFYVRLNGYPISSWQGKQAHSLEMSYAVSLCDPDISRRFGEACGQAARHEHVRFHSSLLLLCAGLRITNPECSDHVIIDVHGESTDIAIVKNDACAFFGSCPIGTDTIVRKLAHAAHTDDRAADSLLALYIGERLDAEHAQSVGAVLNRLTAEWSGGLSKLAVDAAGRSILLSPRTLITSSAHEGFFARIFQTANSKTRVETLPDPTGLYALAIVDMI